MGLDIRTPIGLMFSVFGLLLTIYGAVSDKRIYQASLGLNINFGWGLVLLTFGVVMLLLGSRGSRKMQSGHTPAETQPRRGH